MPRLPGPIVVGGALVLLIAALLLFGTWGRPEAGVEFGAHRVTVADYRAGLAEGVLWPRWSAAAFDGFGSPAPVFRPPIPYWLAAAATAVAPDAAVGFRLAAIVVMVLGAWGMTVLLARRTNRIGALVGALAFTSLPFAVFAFHVQFAWDAFCALAWLPFILLAAGDLIERTEPGGGVRFAIGGAGLALTHLPTALVFLTLVLLWLLAESLRRRHPQLAIRSVVLVFFAACGAAAYLLPMVLERSFIQGGGADRLVPYPWYRALVLHDPTVAGYAPVDLTAINVAALVQILLALGAGLVLRAVGRLNGRNAYWFGVSLLLFFFASALAEPWWRLVSPLATVVGTPWLLLAAQGVITAWLVGLAVGAAVERPRPLVALAPVALPGLLALVVVVIGLREANREGERGYGLLPAGPVARAAVDDPTFLPRGVSASTVRGFEAMAEKQWLVLEGQASVEPGPWTAHRRELTIDAGPRGATIGLRLFAGPGWTAFVDGERRDLTPVPNLGAATLEVPAGRHTVRVRNMATSARRAGLWATLAALFLGAVYVVRYRGARAAPPARSHLGRRTLALVGTVMIAGLFLPRLVWPMPTLRPNVVLITGSGFRSDRARFNGYARPTTLSIDRVLLPGGIRFRRAYTPVTNAAAAAESLIGASSWVERLRQEGYATIAFLGENLTAGRPDLSRHFPEIVEPSGNHAFVPGATLRAEAARWLEQHRGGPFLLWMHLAEAGTGLRTGALEFNSPIQNADARFDEALARADHAMGGLFEDLEAGGVLDLSVVAVAGLTADESTPDALGENATSVWLALRLNGRAPRGLAVESTPVGTAALGSTVLMQLGLAEPAGGARWTLFDAVLGDAPPDGVVVRRADDRAGVRIFEGFKIYRIGAGEPRLVEVLPWPPWQRPWKGPPPEDARRWLTRE